MNEIEHFIENVDGSIEIEFFYQEYDEKWPVQPAKKKIHPFASVWYKIGFLIVKITYRICVIKGRALYSKNIFLDPPPSIIT